MNSNPSECESACFGHHYKDAGPCAPISNRCAKKTYKCPSIPSRTEHRATVCRPPNGTRPVRSHTSLPPPQPDRPRPFAFFRCTPSVDDQRPARTARQSGRRRPRSSAEPSGSEVDAIERVQTNGCFFGHETAFWHNSGETPFRMNPTTWGFPNCRISLIPKTAGNRLRTCQNAVFVAKIERSRRTGGSVSRRGRSRTIVEHPSRAPSRKNDSRPHPQACTPLASRRPSRFIGRYPRAAAQEAPRRTRKDLHGAFPLPKLHPSGKIPSQEAHR